MVNQIETNGTNQKKKVIQLHESKMSKKGSFIVHFGPALKIIKKSNELTPEFE